MSTFTSNPCPHSHGDAPRSASLDKFDKRWDLARSASVLCPDDSTFEIGITESARQAWRNSVRCIGRRLWRSLEVIDARSVDDPEGIFDSLVSHLRLATNGGQVRPVMTVFRKYLEDMPELRIWNHQLLRYAGYKQRDGTTLGDPMNLKLTEIAISLGWRPPNSPGPFDLLPVIIQVGERLHYFDLPKSEILEVSIRHPKHSFMEDMDLRWYAVPIVSDMIFATGSTLFPCAPFNGHYLGTEIGARNLGDSNRYNLLPEVAVRMGLDISKQRNLWKDHALLTLNEAVLWSFDTEGVRIADHHGASEDFLRFCQQEKNSGREVSAEWSWIVPPISGSATPVFHQRFSIEPSFPNFLLQIHPWRTERGTECLITNTNGIIERA